MKKNLVRLCLGIIVLALSIFVTESRSSAQEINQNNNQKLTGVREDIQGELEVIVEDGKNNWRTLYNLKTGGKTLALHFAKEPKNLQTGMKVRVRGVRSGNDVTADSLVTEDLGGSSTPTDLQASATALSNTTGEHKVAVILVNFQDLQTQPFTVAQAQDVTFNQTSGFYSENSYGQTWLTGDVFGWFTIPVSSTNCDINAIGTYAQQAATKAGANLSAYQHYVYAFPHTMACTFSGRSSIGGNPSQSWINTDSIGIEVLGHELGHAFGLLHSRSMSCGGSVIGTNCSFNEYGDAFDIMGASMPVHFNAYQKERLGWLNYGGSPPLQTITASGTYRIDTFETAGSSAKGLKILKSTDPVTGYKTWYYVEKRTAAGFDSYLSPYNAMNGVLVHTGSEADGQDIYLLDGTPATNSFFDSALTVGQSFTDSAAGVTISTVSADNTGAWVQVTVGSQPCTHANPSVSVSPGQSQWLRSGTKFTYSVTITNNESSGCSTGTFNLQGAVPGGWVASYSASSLSLAPGASATASFYVTSPAGTPDGMYNVNAAAVNGLNSSYGSSATAAYSIVSVLGVTASTSASTYSRTQKASATAVVSAGGFAVSGAAVTFTMTKSDGSVVTQTAITASNGTAIFTYSFNKRKDPLGTYQVKAVSSANGLTGQAATSFLVNK
jgi:hypothetical protein